MNPTLRPAPPRHYYSPVTRVGAYLHVHYPELSSRSWDQVIRGPANVPARFVAICEAATALGDTVLLERLLAPVEATVAGAPIPPFGPAIRLTAQMADLAEDESEARWIADPSTDHLRAWLRAIDAQRAAHRSLRMSIATHLEAP